MKNWIESLKKDDSVAIKTRNFNGREYYKIAKVKRFTKYLVIVDCGGYEEKFNKKDGMAKYNRVMGYGRRSEMVQIDDKVRNTNKMYNLWSKLIKLCEKLYEKVPKLEINDDNKEKTLKIVNEISIFLDKEES